MSAAAALALSLGVWFAPMPDEPVAPQVDELYDDVDFQRSLPVPDDDGVGSAGGGGRPSGDDWSEGWPGAQGDPYAGPQGAGGQQGPRRERPRPYEGPRIDLSALGTLLEVLAWTLAGAVALVLLLALVRAVGRGRREAKASGVRGGGEPARASLAGPREEAEALAAQGRFDEAVHALLLRTIDALGRTAQGGVPASWTAREIQRDAPMPRPARDAFGDLADAVERSLFGGRSVGEGDWRSCRDRFGAFEAAYQGGAP